MSLTKKVKKKNKKARVGSDFGMQGNKAILEKFFFFINIFRHHINFNILIQVFFISRDITINTFYLIFYLAT